MTRISWSRIGGACVALLMATTGAAAAQADAPGSADHPLVSRMPNFDIQSYETQEFDSHTFYVGYTETPVEGRHYYYLYTLRPGATEPSILQILRNYENALTAIGGEVLTSNYDGHSCMKVEKDGKEVWVHVSGLGTAYHLDIIEREAMRQGVTADADAFFDSLRATGRVAVYGILFDTGRSAVKDESAPTLAEIARLLIENEALRLYVVGHTDNVGTMESNMSLSKARAEAVVAYLVEHFGIEAHRLRGYGVSSLAPVASNDTEDGRAQNRRVELVKQ